MSVIRFSGFLGFVGVVGGVVIALGLPWIILVYGAELAPGWRVAIILLALLGGASLAIASAVVGITIPTAIHDGKLDLNRYAKACCGQEGATERPGNAVGDA